MTAFLQDRQVARERAKRRMVAANIRAGYKHRDPSKIPVKASLYTESKVAEHAISIGARKAPFVVAQNAGTSTPTGSARRSPGREGGGIGGSAGRDPGPDTGWDISNAVASGGITDAQLDWIDNTFGNNWVKGAAALIGLATGAPIGSVMTVARWLSNRERNKRGGRDLSDANNKEWGNYDTGGGPAQDYGRGYEETMHGSVSVYDLTPTDAYRSRYWGTDSSEKPR